ncbi:unnamed protein product, partial [Vitis vinifera]
MMDHRGVSIIINRMMEHSPLDFPLSNSILQIKIIGITLVFSAPLPLQLISLLALKSSLKDPLSTLHGWDPTPSLSTPAFHRPLWCSWSGVKCDPKTSHVTSLDLSRRNLSGTIPPEIRYLSTLNHLNLSGNAFDGPFPPSDIIQLRYLEFLNLAGNALDGPIPPDYARLTALKSLDLSNNQLTGSIPEQFTSLKELTILSLMNNELAGEIPQGIGDLPNLDTLSLWNNSLTGTLPQNLGSNAKLMKLDVSSNFLTGSIPLNLCLGNHLIKLILFGNRLVSELPNSLANCTSLMRFRYLNISENAFDSHIPWDIGHCMKLLSLNLRDNSLTGIIPWEISTLPSITDVDLSHNFLTGTIPSNFDNCSTLESFNVSFNLLTVVSKPCAAGTEAATAEDMGPWKLTAFQRLNFSADDVVECISMTDKIIGMGSTGTVYKAEMRGGEMIAVKKLWGKQKETVRKRRGVVAEVDVLGNVRHRNIVRLLGWCSNSDSTMLLYEYMPNGSLDDLLHGKNKGDNLVADWYTRYKIALGVAQGICYLHHDCDPVIVHRDLKPSNILLDADMEARVADFGVAKLIQCDESMSVIAGSYGYIAPEYAYTLQVDEKSDIYSYGVVLLEILSGKRSVEGEFGEGNSIVDWVRLKIKNKNGVDEVLDKNAGASCPSVREEMMLLLRVALLCTSRNPADRPSMRDVVSMLQEAKPKRKLPASVGSGGAAAAAAATPLPQKQTVDC